jgi:uncharacterized membrane protein YuzA (DUF378 family)
MKALNPLAAVLLIVGGLNWGLVAIAEFDLVAWITGAEFGETNVVSRIVYGLVGLAAVYGITQLASRNTKATSLRSASTEA